MLKTGIKYLKRILLGLLILLAGYFLVAIILSIISTNPEELTCNKDKAIFITTNGVHLDIIIPRDYLSKEIQHELQINEKVEYVSFGWGDKGFYLETPTWNDLNFKTAIKALFLKSETAIHLTYYNRKYDRWLKQPLCDYHLEILIDYLNQSFEKDEQGKVIEIKESGYTQYDKFYEAKGNYNCIHTCNEWVNEGLKKAEIKTSIWSPFDYGVLYQIRNQ